MSRVVIATESYRARRAVVPETTADHLTVEVARELPLDCADARAVDAMIDSRPNVGFFLSKSWLSTLFETAPAEADLSLALLRQGPHLRAIVPIAVRRPRGHVRISLVGGGSGSDCVDLLAARGFEAAAGDAFLTWLRDTFGNSGFLLELRDVPASSPLWGAIQRAGMERSLNLVLQPREIYTLPFLPLPFAAPAEESTSARALGSLQKHRRWLEHRCRLHVDQLRSLEDVMAAFEHLVQFLRARWKGDRRGSVLDDAPTIEFHRRVLPKLLEDGSLRMIRLSGDERTIAVFYGVARQRWWGYYLAGYDREWAGRIRLGQITLASAIEMAAREGATEFDFLKGAERIKYVWPVCERAALDADVFSDAAGAQFTRATRATRDAAAALSKSARGLFAAHATV